MRRIELLAPAKDLVCGIEAIRHGADAVYIGAPKFSARAAAGNTIEDIRALCEFAHIYNVRVYVALNTLLKEEELDEVERLIWQLYEVGVDALIVQDMGVTQLNLPPIPLHASTQTDNRTPEKVGFLADVGFSQVVLARELSLKEIKRIADSVSVALEVFVHGALCVCYSGQCYLSAALSGRSANRGECAQYCRLPYTLVDAEGEVILREKHLLSLKDMNRSDYLEQLIDAGVSSFKIEGRLKEVSYVKNVTAFYRKKLDAILLRRKEYERTSVGVSTFSFEPVVEKSFNRGFTDYLLSGRSVAITSFDTPKSIGEEVGRVKEIHRNSFTVSGIKTLNNGDGLAFFDQKGVLQGFRANRVDVNKVYPAEMPVLRPKTVLYRNFDQAFEKVLAQKTAERKINVRLTFSENRFGYTLEIRDTSGVYVMVTRTHEKEMARNDQTENIRKQLTRLGNTPFEVQDVEIVLQKNWFVPSSLLSDMRRQAAERLVDLRKIRFNRELVQRKTSTSAVFPTAQLTYLGNVSNDRAIAFYTRHGVSQIDPAYELAPRKDVPLMFTKYCLKYSLGYCMVHQKGKSVYKEPFFLLYKDKKLRLSFDCNSCQMLVFVDE
ncbi:U32 family peptidase [Parabacteroides sp. PF5-9]|uniref:peptidase U32 family protein n=1 Tax=Parabacteroides sp. PF5-9 TaxID=1742404 RepID=UPI0024767D0D|nr:U32 family peptidase [Parabacteroides sp. PF5-9]MDH6357853.1 collagenase-like PrtC family protease [Parabacteroides sp. PF5-9]